MSNTVEISIEVDEVLLKGLKAFLEPMGLTPEDLIIRFLEFCADPEREEEAIRLIRSWREE